MFGIARLLLILPMLTAGGCDEGELDEDELEWLDEDEDDLLDEEEGEEDTLDRDTVDEVADLPRPTHGAQPPGDLPVIDDSGIIVEPVPPPDDLTVDEDDDVPDAHPHHHGGPQQLRDHPPHGDPFPPIDDAAVEPGE